MSRKDTIAALFTQKKAATAAPPTDPERERVKTGAISAMGASLQHLTESARNAARLQEQIEEGTVIVKLDPAAIDSGMVMDRLQPAVDPSFDALVASIRESGQQIPILVRPISEAPRRYQVAYGHRRLRAARQLGIEVKAIVRPMTDAEMVVAQGKENLERRDLSYIEKSIFARRLEDAGFDRATIIAALSTDKADLSRYISVARLIPDALAQAIGPADRIGRARWLVLADNLQRPDAAKQAEAVLAGEAFARADSNARFALVLKAVSEPEAAAKKPAVRIWQDPDGKKVLRIESRKDETALVVDEAVAPAFGDFLLGEIETLYQRYLQSRSDRRD
ncbi:plasmid partitioning protein RepB [Pseudochelatococcus sp. B33]